MAGLDVEVEFVYELGSHGSIPARDDWATIGADWWRTYSGPSAVMT